MKSRSRDALLDTTDVRVHNANGRVAGRRGGGVGTDYMIEGPRQLVLRVTREPTPHPSLDPVRVREESLHLELSLSDFCQPRRNG